MKKKVKPMPRYLREARNELIMELNRKGYNFQNIAQILNMTKPRVFQIVEMLKGKK